VAHQADNERNFHIFYQLLRGADASLLSRLRLSDEPKTYNYLNQSGCDTIDTMDDVFGWEETVDALNVVEFSDGEKDQVWELLAAILHISNLTFGDTVATGGQAGSKLTSDPSALCALIGADEAELEETLTVRRVNTSRESVATPVTKDTAMSAARGMSKALYSKLFSWVVQRVNQSIEVTASKTRKSIGVLDIYGFEIFGVNSFEQFIINYCNEKLQQIFIELTLKMEQAEYVREGIPWKEIEYFDNRIICELIESRSGILALLDDYCMRPVRYLPRPSFS
jgi:myosin-1